MNATIVAVGTCAPGMLDWDAAKSVLRSESPWTRQPLPKLDVPLLPVAERRRVNGAARLAIAAASQATSATSTAAIASVFATADGDGQVLASSLQTLCDDATAMSPTLFHNSVFNAPAGYWTIASRCGARSTTVSAGMGSFAAGLLEAVVEVATGETRVLLVAADQPFPSSLAAFEVTGEPFACALLLAPAGGTPGPGCGSLCAQVHDGEARHDDGLVSAAMIDAFRGNPAARALPLVAAIARGIPAVIDVPYLDGCRLTIAYSP